MTTNEQKTPKKPTLNELYGLTGVSSHNLNNKTYRCKKCGKHIKELEGETKLCGIIGREEVAQFRDYDNR